MGGNRIRRPRQTGAPEHEIPLRKALMALFNRYLAREACYEARFIPPEVGQQLLDGGLAVQVPGGWRITDAGIVAWARMSSEALRTQDTLTARLMKDIAETGNPNSPLLPRCSVCGEVCMSYIKRSGLRGYYKRCQMHQIELWKRLGRNMSEVSE